MNLLTHELMLRYLYNEMTNEEASQFWQFLESNPVSMEQFNALKESIETLATISYTPEKNTIDKVLSYAALNGISLQ